MPISRPRRVLLERVLRPSEFEKGKIHQIKGISQRGTLETPALLVSIPVNVCFFLPSNLVAGIIHTPGVLAALTKLETQQSLGIRSNSGQDEEVQLKLNNLFFIFLIHNPKPNKFLNIFFSTISNKKPDQLP